MEKGKAALDLIIWYKQYKDKKYHKSAFSKEEGKVLLKRISRSRNRLVNINHR